MTFANSLDPDQARIWSRSKLLDIQIVLWNDFFFFFFLKQVD